MRFNFDCRLSKAVGAFTVIAGVGLFFNLPTFLGVKLGLAFTISNILWQFSLLTVAGWSLLSKQQKQS